MSIVDSWTPASAVASICERFDVTAADLEGDSRDAWLGKARGALAAELRAHGMALGRIGAKYLGGRDHSSVAYLISRAER